MPATTIPGTIPWTRQGLEALVKAKLGDHQFVVVSNREPYVHALRKSKMTWQRPPGGLVAGLDPIMRACHGLWMAAGSGEADRRTVDAHNRVDVPPNDPQYRLKRLWLSKEEENRYYYGFANEALWPLCHIAFVRPIFRQTDWETYQAVNERFAAEILKEIGDQKAFVWIQDYHLALVARYLKAASPRIITAQFWHIPWPNAEVFRICPSRVELLEGLLANDLLGLQTRYHCDNFLATVDRELEAKIDRERFAVVRGGRETLVRPFPISVDVPELTQRSQSAPVEEIKQRYRDEFGITNGMQVVLGFDRIDYTKGIPERLRAVDRLFERHPELKGKIVMLQMGALSRIHLASYKEINDQINAQAEQINWKHGSDGWKPIVLIRQAFNETEASALYALADVCVVSSLHDGMNLISKEFVASRPAGNAMLVLSRFTGAARELTDAVLVNPYDIEEMAEGLYRALTMPAEERQRRMMKMRELLTRYNIYRWAGKTLSELLKFEFPE